MSARMVFSEITWSTCLSLMMSDFLRRFIAKNSPVFLFLASITLPKEPIHHMKHERDGDWLVRHCLKDSHDQLLGSTLKLPLNGSVFWLTIGQSKLGASNYGPDWNNWSKEQWRIIIGWWVHLIWHTCSKRGRQAVIGEINSAPLSERLSCSLRHWSMNDVLFAIDWCKILKSRLKERMQQILA